MALQGIEALMEAMVEECKERTGSPEQLREGYEKFTEEPPKFKPRDLVEWKPGMKHKKGDGPFIVVEVLDTPVIDHNERASSPHFREKLDIVLGEINKNCFITFHYDSRRLQPYTEPESAPTTD